MRTYIKQVEGFEGFLREVECYKRLAWSKHVPNLISKDIKNWKLEIEWAGDSVQQLQWQNRKVEIPGMFQQLNQIAKDFKEANIMHLDASVGNVCVRDGVIYIIDFEKVCIDSNPDSHKLNKRFVKLQRQGGMTKLIRNWADHLETVLI